jgi:hypothetical protein
MSNDGDNKSSPPVEGASDERGNAADDDLTTDIREKLRQDARSYTLAATDDPPRRPVRGRKRRK